MGTNFASFLSFIHCKLRDTKAKSCQKDKCIHGSDFNAKRKRKLRICSHLLKKALMKNFLFCTVLPAS